MFSVRLGLTGSLETFVETVGSGELHDYLFQLLESSLGKN